MTIKQNLKNLGFSDKEVIVYLALLKQGKSKPSDLAKMTKLNRATLYNIADNLKAKGLITEDISEKTRHFTPLPTENLGNILEQNKKELVEKQGLVNKAIAQLSLITADKSYPVPKITFVEEDNLEKYLFNNLEKWQNEIQADDGIWWGYQDHTFVDVFEKWIDYTWKVNKGHYRGQVFSNESEVEKKLQKRYHSPKRQVRYLAETDFTATTWVCGNFLIMIMTQSRPYYLIEIDDELLAKNTREIFKKLWQSTEK